MENKINIQSKDGKLLIGNAFHVLEDESIQTYETDDIESFLKYVKMAEKSEFKFLYIYTEDSIEAWFGLNEKIRNNRALAVCQLQPSSILTYLEKHMNMSRGMSLDDFEKFLKTLLPYGNANGEDYLKLLSELKDFKISKVLKIERNKDQAGNYSYLVQRKSDGKNDFIPPQTLVFQVPVFRLMADKIMPVELNLSFDFSDQGEGVKMVFTLECIMYQDLLFACQKAIIEEKLSKLSNKYWGETKVVELTDAWKYQENYVKGL